MRRPIIVLVPGAWHYPETFQPFASHLKQLGYQTQAISLPSVSSTPLPLKDHSADTEAIRATVKDLIDSGNDVIVFGHSYGSIPLSDALQGLPRSNQGTGGGIKHVIHANGFVLQENESLVDAVVAAGDSPSWFSISEDGMVATVQPGRAHDVIYADLDAETAAKEEAKLGRHSAATFMSKQQYTAWKDFPTTYITCSDDICVRQETQKIMMEKCSGMQIVRLKGSHCPYLSQVTTVADIVRKAAGEHI